MPQVRQKWCFAVPVLNVYVARSSCPETSSNASRPTMRWMNPFFTQIEQLQTTAAARSPRTAIRTRPQWQPPS